MTDTVFVDKSEATPIVAAWLNDQNNATYHAIGNGTNAPTTPAQVLTNLGFTASSGASLSGYVESYTGAIPTTVQSRLRYMVCALDYYANGVSGAAVDPTGAVDSTLGIQAALNTGRAVWLPKGTYKVSTGLTYTSDGQMLFGDGRFGQTIISWAGAINSTVIGNSNTTLRNNIVLRDLRIQSSANGVTGIDYSHMSYSTIERVQVQCYGSNTVGVLLTGNTAGDRPYYNTYDQVDVSSDNVNGVTTGSIGWYLKRVAASMGSSNFNGPNASNWKGGRLSGMAKGVVVEDGIGNTFVGMASESITTNHFEFGVAAPFYPANNGAATFAATVNTLTDNSAASWAVNQFTNGVIYIYSGTGVGQYREILSNTATVYTVNPYWDIVPDNTSTYQIFPEAGQNNTLMGCYGEGDSIALPNYVKTYPGPISTFVYGGLQSSLGKIINDIPRIGNRFNPGGWKDPVAITFSLAALAGTAANAALSPVGWTRNNLSIPGFWHIQSMDIGMNGTITSGTVQIWVTQNGTKINTNPDVTITSASSSSTSGGSVKQKLFGSNDILSTSTYSQLGLLVTTTGVLPAAALDLFVTLYVVNRG